MDDQGHKCFMVRLHRCPELIKADINVALQREWEDNTAFISLPRLTRQMGYNLPSSSHIADDLKYGGWRCRYVSGRIAAVSIISICFAVSGSVLPHSQSPTRQVGSIESTRTGLLNHQYYRVYGWGGCFVSASRVAQQQSKDIFTRVNNDKDG